MAFTLVVAEEAKRWQARLAESGSGGEIAAVEVDREACELADAAIDVVRALGEQGRDISTVIGVGPGGRAAHLMALAGRASGLVLVDGLTHRFAQPAEVIAARMEWMRRRVAGDFPAIPRVESRSFAERAAAAVRAPTLVVESAASATPSTVAEAVAKAFPDATLVRVTDEAEAVTEILSWSRRGAARES